MPSQWEEEGPESFYVWEAEGQGRRDEGDKGGAGIEESADECKVVGIWSDAGPGHSDQAVDLEEVRCRTMAITRRFSRASIAIRRFIEKWKGSLAVGRSILDDDHG